jgi:hypothetical protein
MDGSARVLIEVQCGNIDGQSRTRLYERAACRINTDEKRAADLAVTRSSGSNGRMVLRLQRKVR